MSFNTFCKTVNVKAFTTSIKSNRLERMVNTYITEEPKLTLEFLQDMKDKQKNACCYCSVSMCNKYGQPQSITLERVDDSKKHILNNIKLACSACNSGHRKK